MKRSEKSVPEPVEALEGEIVLAERPGSLVLGQDDDDRADQNPCAIYLGKLLEGPSRDSTRGALGMFLRALLVVPPGMERSKMPVDISTFPWKQLRAKHFDAARAVLMAEFAPASANKAINSARGVMKRARREKQISGEDFEDIKNTERVPGKRELAGRAIPDDEAAAFLELCAKAVTPLELRDAGVVVLIWGSGCRRREASTTDFDSYDPKGRSIRVMGKGQKARTVPLSSAVCEFIDRWIDVRGREPGPLFYANARRGELRPEKRMSGQNIYDRCSIIGHKACGVWDITPHNLRRTAITEQLGLPGSDMLIVGRNVGQEDPKTTGLYDRRPMDRQREVVDQRKMPKRK